MIEVATADGVVAAVKASGWRRVGVDGVDGSGKSTLAGSLAAELGWRLLSLDDYLERDRGGFLDFLDYSRLRADVCTETHLVIEGICLLHALDRAKVSIDALVYVKRRRLGLWADEDELDLNEPLEDFLERERQLVGMVTGGTEAATNLGLAEEVIRYHYAARPHNNAQIVYYRDER